MATLCGQQNNGRLLLSHVVWLLNKANDKSQDSACFCIPPPRSSPITTSTAQAEEDTQKKDFISTLICVISVQKKRNGTVVIAPTPNSADHRVLAVVDFTKQSVLYCDSLGWNVPTSLVESLLDLCQKWNLPCLPTHAQVIPVHVPSAVQDSTHACTSLCRNYPSLQSPGSAGGIITVVFAVVAALDREFFQTFMEPHSSQNNRGVLHDPHKHEDFLRRMLISWFMNEDINISVLHLQKPVEPVVPDKKVMIRKIQHQLKKIRPEVCSYCGVVVRGIYNLRSHKMYFHKQEIDRILSRPTKRMSVSKIKAHELCPFCGVTLTEFFTLKKHIERFHSARSDNIRRRRFSQCVLCAGFQMKRTHELINHYREVHDKDIQVFHKAFANKLEFSMWKNDIERKTYSSFTPIGSTKMSLKGVHKTQYLYCHRSGFNYNQKKTKGDSMSTKMNNHCTAFMFARFNVIDGSVNVEYCLYHIGHSLGLGIEFNRTKSYVLERLSQGATGRKIQEELRSKNNACGGSTVGRSTISYLNKRYNIFQVQKHKVDAQSLHLWVTELEQQAHNPIIYYKAQHSPHDVLDQQDFLVCIQTDLQRSALVEKTPRFICVDSTQMATTNDFVLSTVLVSDGHDEGVPVAWAISNREDSKMFHLFFTAVRRSCQRELETDVFMGDLTDLSYNAWLKVFSKTQNRLFSSWHVHRSWHEKVKSVMKREADQSAYIARMADLQRETDDEKFSKALQDFLIFLQQNAPTLYDYFYEHFIHNNKLHLWGGCFRKATLARTDVHLESFHKVIEDIHLEKKRTKRMDDLLMVLLKLARDKALDQIKKSHREKVRNHIKDLRAKPHTRIRRFRKRPVEDVVLTEPFQCGCGQACTSCYSCIHKCMCKLKSHLIKKPEVLSSEPCVNAVPNSSKPTTTCRREDADSYGNPDSLINDEATGTPDFNAQIDDGGRKENLETLMDAVGRKENLDMLTDDVGRKKNLDTQMDDGGEKQILDTQMDVVEGIQIFNTQMDVVERMQIFNTQMDVGGKQSRDELGGMQNLDTQIDDIEEGMQNFDTQFDDEASGKFDLSLPINFEAKIVIDLDTEMDDELERDLKFNTPMEYGVRMKQVLKTDQTNDQPRRLPQVETLIKNETEREFVLDPKRDDESGGSQDLQGIAGNKDRTLISKDIENIRALFLHEISSLLDFGIQCDNVDSLDMLYSHLKKANEMTKVSNSD